MSIERVRAYLKPLGLDTKILELTESSATVQLAAHALGVEPARIAKTLSFEVGDRSLVIVTAGDVKIDNKKYRDVFHQKAKMIKPEDLEERIGHSMGGVCPFALHNGVEIYLDESLKRFSSVFPACGSSNSAIELTPEELEQYTKNPNWIDVTKEISR